MPNFRSSPWMRGAPQRGIRATHLVDQIADVDGDRGATEAAARGPPAPMPGEEATMPADDGGGFHDLHGTPPASPHLREQDPEESINATEPEPSGRGLLENCELVAACQYLRFKLRSSSETGTNRGENGNDAGTHLVHVISARFGSSTVIAPYRLSNRKGISFCGLIPFATLGLPRIDPSQP